MLFWLLPVLMVEARRRLSADECAHQAYVLARGAPLERGQVFPRQQRTFVDFAIDETGAGTALVARMPACQRASAVSLKFTSPQGRDQALVFLQDACAAAECVLYTNEVVRETNFVKL